MYLYRAMSSDELKNRLNGIETNKAIIMGENTFNYEKDIDYIHFYKFSAHAFLLRDKFKLACIAKVEMADELIPKLEYGFYSDIETYYDDSLTRYYIPLPEIIIDRKLFNNSDIIKFSNELNGNFDADRYQKMLVVSRKRLFEEEQTQIWNPASIYYEYIKSLLPKFNYNTTAVAKYLKTINLDDELNIMTKTIQKKKILTERKYSRISGKNYY